MAEKNHTEFFTALARLCNRHAAQMEGDIFVRFHDNLLVDGEPGTNATCGSTCEVTAGYNLTAVEADPEGINVRFHEPVTEDKCHAITVDCTDPFVHIKGTCLCGEVHSADVANDDLDWGKPWVFICKCGRELLIPPSEF